MKLRDFINSHKAVCITANTFRPIIVGCGSGHCGFTIVACGGYSGGCGAAGWSSYSYHNFGCGGNSGC